MAPKLSHLTQPQLIHWLGWVAMIVIGGSAFGAIRLAVDTAEPGIVSGVRLWLAALLLTAYALAGKREFPPLLDQDGKGLDKRWVYMLACGIFGYTIPFWLFPFAQQTISSLLAGIYMAFMPLVTLFLAAIFTDEALTRKKFIGFILGTTGVVLLMGPSAFSGAGGTDALIAQGAVLLATIGYAIFAILTRRAPEMPARSFAAGMLICAALTTTPLMIFSGQDWNTLSIPSTLGMIWLGIFPSGVAAILLIWLIRSVGAGFMAMGNYLTPIVAILIGTFFFKEDLRATFLIGLCFILAGLAISQWTAGAQAGNSKAPRK